MGAAPYVKMVLPMLQITILTALAYETRKSLQLLETLAESRAANFSGTQTDPLNAVILRRRRHAAVLRSMMRAAGAERTQPPIMRPASIDLDTLIAAEARHLAFLERQQSRQELPEEMRNLIAEHREDVHQAALILSRLRDRDRST
jgi:hypothetical protein